MKTVSLELAKQLKELGFPQKTEFYWNDAHENRLSDGSWDKVPTRLLDKGHYHDTSPNDDFFAAPTADEILDLLPEFIQLVSLTGITISKYKNFYCIWYCNHNRQSVFGSIMNISDENLADAAAKMWIFLKKGNFLGGGE